MADSSPLARLAEDRRRALEINDPCANLCTLATVDAAGHPQARTLVLRDLDGRLAVFCNTTSPKWQQVQLGASLAIVVLLPVLQVQYRLQCDAEPVPRKLVRESWQLRPDVPKRLDWLYTRRHPQSSKIATRETLAQDLRALAVPEPLVAPDTASGLYLDAFRIERLDLGAPDGLHDRRLYARGPGGWSETVLVP